MHPQDAEGDADRHETENDEQCCQPYADRPLEKTAELAAMTSATAQKRAMMGCCLN
jgi:hypothetical protein